MRPIYEKPSDRSAEQEVALLYAKNGHSIEHMKKLAPFDVAFIKDKRIKAVAEIKCRNHPYGQFPTYMISADKLSGLHAFHQATKIPALIIVSWSCGKVGHVKIPVEAHFEMGGRVDRSDPMDIEIVAHIPIESFKITRETKP